MVPEARAKYNREFSKEKYASFIEDLNHVYPGQMDFRVAETPLFVPRSFTNKMLSACEAIIDVITQPAYLRQSEKAIPDRLRVPNEDGHPHFLCFDFGVCRTESGELEPQLIEMQGFPSLFAWQVILPEIHARHFGEPVGYSPFLGGHDRASYISLLKKIIVGDEDPAQVVLLELFPHKQKTRVDFYATEDFLGIRTLDLNEVLQEGRRLFYLREGKKTPIRRVYNRVIFDDLLQQNAEVQEKGRLFQEDLDLTWVPHPNWFYRLSKFTLPFITHPFVPETRFLDQAVLPDDLSGYVVKPLFSFAGQGVLIDVTRKDLDNIADPENWIIQRKVSYAPVVPTPDEPAKAEIRLFYFWEEGKARPVATQNLSRLSKGKMIGVRYNKDREWVGGSFCLFEQ